MEITAIPRPQKKARTARPHVSHRQQQKDTRPPEYSPVAGAGWRGSGHVDGATSTGRPSDLMLGLTGAPQSHRHPWGGCHEDVQRDLLIWYSSGAKSLLTQQLPPAGARTHSLGSAPPVVPRS
ncbi:hypothetical protein E2C01_083575 [Portunus trituberculatus]|uniref:Uncharacterized protein n=1 Tax=Portunus trituberculatus TaxID=210409 RepID=A0A5B7J248_PORTR|nr:hypothetical protein [Portunus trituberculatus]